MKTANKNDILRCIVLLTGTAMICIGIYLGEPQQILQKAVKLCLECIGIG